MNMHDTQTTLGNNPIIGFIMGVGIYISNHLLNINLYEWHIPHIFIESLDLIAKAAIAGTALLTFRGWYLKGKKEKE